MKHVSYEEPQQVSPERLAGVDALPLCGARYDGESARVPVMFGCIAASFLSVGRECYALDLDCRRWRHLFTCGRDWHSQIGKQQD